ncbi:hypothetical protein [Thomasclavelia spiroformis]|nr:hypothetical protein [Thomasclavelia spiroformis]
MYIYYMGNAYSCLNEQEDYPLPYCFVDFCMTKFCGLKVET